MNPINTAATIAKAAHAGQRYGDAVYFSAHIQRVVDRVKEMTLDWENGGDARDAVIAAYLHDVTEDTAITLKEIAGCSFSRRVIDALHLLDRRGLDYLEYISLLDQSVIARTVKIADLRTNLAANPDEKHMQRYNEALNKLISNEA